MLRRIFCRESISSSVTFVLVFLKHTDSNIMQACLLMVLMIHHILTVGIEKDIVDTVSIGINY